MRRTHPLVLVVTLVVSLALVRPAAAGWELHQPPAGNVATLALDPTNPDRVLTGNARSTDAGATWTTTAPWTSVAFDTAGVAYQSQVLVSLGGATLKIFRSIDGGATTSLVFTRAFPPSCNIGVQAGVVTDPVTPGVVLVGGILRTIDGGSSWTSGQGSGRSAAGWRSRSPSDPSVVYAARFISPAGVYKSTDAGLTYARLVDGFGIDPVDAVASLAIDPTDADVVLAGTGYRHVHRSVDGGVTWQQEWDGLGGGDVAALTFVPGCPNVVLAATAGAAFPGAAGGVFRSENGGFTWHEVGDGIPKLVDVVGGYRGGVGVLAIDPSTPGRVHAGSNLFWAFRSDDGGEHWVPSLAGGPNDHTRYVTTDPLDPATVYVDHWRSRDGGRSWAPITNGLDVFQVGRLAIAPSLPSMLYLSTVFGVLESADQGDTWTRRSFALFPVGDSTIAVDPVDPLTAYAAHSTSLLVQKTTDGGFNWSIWNPPGFPMAAALAIDPSNPSTLYGVMLGGGITKSTDAGTTFSAANTGIGDFNLRSLVLDPSAPQVLYTAGDGGVYVTLDGAATWAPSAPLPGGPTAIGVLAVNPVTRAVYLGTQGSPHVLESPAGAGAWSDLTSDLPTSFETALAVTADGRDLYASGNGVYRLQVTACTADADCEDGSTCTTDTCDLGECSSLPLPDGTGCDDGNPTTTDTCVAGACRSTTVDAACPASTDLPGALVVTKVLLKPTKDQAKAQGTVVLGVGETIDPSGGLAIDLRVDTLVLGGTDAFTGSYAWTAGECVISTRQISCRSTDKQRKLVLKTRNGDPTSVKLTLTLKSVTLPGTVLVSPVRLRLMETSTVRWHVGDISTCSARPSGFLCKP
jgi:photosystem II stability/assembly factor-like uncharacterized protein